MPTKYIYMVVAGIAMVGVALFLIIYGIKAGLMEKKILINSWTHLYATDQQAIKRGVFYIIIGLIMIVVYLWAVIKTIL
jgi:hypothetical protein